VRKRKLFFQVDLSKINQRGFVTLIGFFLSKKIWLLIFLFFSLAVDYFFKIRIESQC